MIPRLYAAGTTTFDNEGLGALSDCISCEVSNSINGVPELDLTYPTTGVHANEIGERCVIVADENHNLKGQAFVVRTIDKSTPGTMRIYAIQLAVYYVESTGLEPFTASRLADAIRDMPNYMTNSIPVRVTATLGSSKAFNHSVPSSVKMAMVKPKLDNAQKKYANNKDKLNEEMMKIYQEAGYNPMSGCLPLLIQFPILFGVINVVYNPLTHIVRLSKDVIAQAQTIAQGIEGITFSAAMPQMAIIDGVRKNASLFSSGRCRHLYQDQRRTARILYDSRR